MAEATPFKFDEDWLPAAKAKIGAAVELLPGPYLLIILQSAPRFAGVKGKAEGLDFARALQIEGNQTIPQLLEEVEAAEKDILAKKHKNWHTDPAPDEAKILEDENSRPYAYIQDRKAYTLVIINAFVTGPAGDFASASNMCQPKNGRNGPTDLAKKQAKQWVKAVRDEVLGNGVDVYAVRMTGKVDLDLDLSDLELRVAHPSFARRGFNPAATKERQKQLHLLVSLLMIWIDDDFVAKVNGDEADEEADGAA